MSRTRKDRPYWVVLNQDARYTDHDHRHLGKVHYKRKYHKTSRGEDVYVEVDIVGTADNYLSRMRWSDKFIYSYWRDTVRPATKEPIITVKAALELHSAGRGATTVVFSREMQRSYEMVYSYTSPDACTEGEKVPGSRGWRDLPCTPELSRGDDGYWGYTRTMSGPKKSYSRERYGHERNTSRVALSRTARNWNEGYEVEDWDADIDLTAQHHHSMAWDLY